MTPSERWRRLTRRQQTILLVFGAMLVIWVVDGIAFRPLRSRLGRLQREVQTAEQHLLQSLIAIRQAEAVEKAFQHYAPYVGAVGSTETELAGFSSEVEAAVQASGLAVLSLKPATLDQRARQDVISVGLEGESSPGQLIRFLELIQRSPRLLKVTSLAIRVSENRTLRCSLTISKLLLTGSGASLTPTVR